MTTSDVIASWQMVTDTDFCKNLEDFSSQLKQDNIEKWLMAWLSKRLKISPESIDRNKSIMSYGLDSMGAVELEREFKNKFNIEISVIDFMENNSIKALVKTGLRSYV